MEKAEIKKIVLDLGDKEVELSLKQAKKLTKLLDEIFGDKTVYVYPRIPVIIEPHNPYPYWTYTSGNAGPDIAPEVWCGDIGGTAIKMSYNNQTEMLKVSL